MERSVRSAVDSNILSKTIICDFFAKFTTFWGIDMTSRCSGALFSALFVENADKYECK